MPTMTFPQWSQMPQQAPVQQPQQMPVLPGHAQAQGMPAQQSPIQVGSMSDNLADVLREIAMRQQSVAQSQGRGSTWGEVIGNLANLGYQKYKLGKLAGQRKEAEAAKELEKKQAQQQLTAILSGAMGQGGMDPQALVQGMTQNPNVDPAALLTYSKALKELMPEGAGDKFEVIQDPYGRGGVAQRNVRTGEIKGYQGPEKEKDRPTILQDGIHYYMDTGERVLPGVKKAAEEPEMLQKVRQVSALREAGDPDSQRAADAIQMDIMFGGKPPEAYVKARGNLDMARTMTSKLYTLIRDKADNPLKPNERAEVNQAHSALVLAFADLQNRGANFTETEQALIDNMLGGSPTNLMGRTLRSRQSYLDRLQEVGDIIEQRGRGLLEAYTSPGLTSPTYPWQRSAPTAPAATEPAGAAGTSAPAAPAGGMSDDDIIAALAARGITAHKR